MLLVGAALCWFCAEGALSRRTAVGDATAAAALPALRVVMAAAVAYTAVYRFCTLFAMEPWLQAADPFALLHCQPPCSILDVRFPGGVLWIKSPY